MAIYKEIRLSENSIIREFEPNVKYEWHRDKRNRIITVLESNDWKIQFDNELPTQLKYNTKYYVPNETFHRIISGDSKLKIKIEEY